MSRLALVLRPAPGDAATAARLEAAGVTAIRLPLFEVKALPWAMPAGDFDGVLLTSANAARLAGAVPALPAIAVGEATAAAARAAGFDVVAVGTVDGAAALALASAHGWRRVIRLAGRERTPLAGVVDIAVYASDARASPPGAMAVAEGSVALLHSTRAAERFAERVDRDGLSRATIRIAAISAKVARAAGTGWAAVAIAATPDDPALVAVAATLAIDP